MKYLSVVSICAALLLGTVNTAKAWHICGHVVCVTDGVATPVIGAEVVITRDGVIVGSDITIGEGLYCVFGLAEEPATYVVSVTPESLPPGATPGSITVVLTDPFVAVFRDILLECGVEPPGRCWLTGGGVKFEALVGDRLAEGGPADSIGGNVFPGCSPTAGDGGQWNHISHANKLHFQGWAVEIVNCGNIENFPPGSSSPKTPFNYIEFFGTGTLKGIQGNKTVYPPVYFFARCEDRNEPGSNGAKDGAFVDRYYLRVYDANNTTLFLFSDSPGNPLEVNPKTITGGNLQLHISSCP